MINKAVSIFETMELPGDKYLRLGESRNNGQPQELDDYDLCVELAYFLSTLLTLKRTKKKQLTRNNNPMSSRHFARDVSNC